MECGELCVMEDFHIWLRMLHAPNLDFRGVVSPDYEKLRFD